MTSIVVGKDRISLIESERYVAGSKNVYLMKIAFSEDWEGLEKHVIFRTDIFDLTLDIAGCSEQFPIPSQIFAKPTNKLQVGVYGGCNGQVTLNTRWLSLGRVVKGVLDNTCCGCNSSSLPSPNTYEMLLEMIKGKADRLTYEDDQIILWSGDQILSSFEMPICEGSGGGCLSLNTPIGAIVAWSGSTTDIPEGYSLCDGQNGTIDLRNSFIMGASDHIKPGPYTKSELESTPMPLTISPRISTDLIQSRAIHVYALAFIQKTSLTDADTKNGKSAYDIAVENGFEGSETEWLESLQGEKGPPGDPGDQGPQGKSAYDLAVENGFQGTEQEWLAKLEAGSALPIIENTIINSKDTAPDKTGDYIFKNVTLQVYDSKARSISVHFDTNVVSVDFFDPTRITFSLIDNTGYIAALNDSGHITEITDVNITSDGGEIIQGPRGDQGPKGDDGKSAYEVAVENGFIGSVSEWLESLKGPQGEQGIQGQKGEKGEKGETGAKGEKGETGSKGDKGDKGDPGPKGETGATGPKGEKGEKGEKGATGAKGEKGEKGATGATGPAGQNGSPGKSAYDIAVENGFKGSEEDWLASLQGEPGEDGRSFQSLEDYSSEESTIVGRWTNKKPVRRIVINLENIEVTTAGVKVLEGIKADIHGMTMISISAIATFKSGDDKGILLGSFSSQLPTMCDDIWFTIRYYPDEIVNNIRLYVNGLVDKTIGMDLSIIFDYVDPNDDELTDDDLVIDDPTSDSTEGTSDHRELSNRDADDQHPIAAITQLSSKLSVRPSSAIDKSEIDALFK